MTAVYELTAQASGSRRQCRSCRETIGSPHAFKLRPEPPDEAAPPHPGEWRDRSTPQPPWCHLRARDSGTTPCRHADIINAPHWSCCGLQDEGAPACGGRCDFVCLACAVRLRDVDAGSACRGEP